jgi:hypothetical protein
VFHSAKSPAEQFGTLSSFHIPHPVPCILPLSSTEDSVQILSELDWAFVSMLYCISQVLAIFRHSECKVLILLIILIFVFGFGGYRMGPGLGYYGGGGLSLILVVVVVLLLLKVI